MKTQTKKPDYLRILEVLQRNEGTFVCSNVFFRELFIKDYAHRIADLRSKGYHIDGRKCDQHDHKINTYKLIKKDYTEKDQLSLIAL